MAYNITNGAGHARTTMENFLTHLRQRLEQINSDGATAESDYYRAQGQEAMLEELIEELELRIAEQNGTRNQHLSALEATS